MTRRRSTTLSHRASGWNHSCGLTFLQIYYFGCPTLLVVKYTLCNFHAGYSAIQVYTAPVHIGAVCFVQMHARTKSWPRALCDHVCVYRDWRTASRLRKNKQTHIQCEVRCCVIQNMASLLFPSQEGPRNFQVVNIRLLSTTTNTYNYRGFLLNSETAHRTSSTHSPPSQIGSLSRCCTRRPSKGWFAVSRTFSRK